MDVLSSVGGIRSRILRFYQINGAAGIYYPRYFLIGAMLMITRKTLFSQIIGFLTIDNAIFLAANSITHGMPLLVELGVLFDLFVSILILSILILNLRRNIAV